MRLYYAVKERFGEHLNNRNDFIKKISEEVKEIVIGKFLHIIIPESSNNFIEDVVKETKIPYTIIKKNDKEYIINNIGTLKLQKKEKEAHLERICDMRNGFQINKLKANQRKKYTKLLFQKTVIESPENCIILDDSCFSSTTYNSLSYATGVIDALFIFSK